MTESADQDRTGRGHNDSYRAARRCTVLAGSSTVLHHTVNEHRGKVAEAWHFVTPGGESEPHPSERER